MKISEWKQYVSEGDEDLIPSGIEVSKLTILIRFDQFSLSRTCHELSI